MNEGTTAKGTLLFWVRGTISINKLYKPTFYEDRL
jgi:hypothetical protein